MSFAPFVEEALTALLSGDDPILEALRAQLPLARVREEQPNELGTWIDFWIEDEAVPLDIAHRFAIDDVFGRVRGIDGEVGLQLHIVRGRIKTLEAWVSEPGWPDKPELEQTWYVAPDDDPEVAERVRTPHRDLDYAVRGIEGDPPE